MPFDKRIHRQKELHMMKLMPGCRHTQQWFSTVRVGEKKLHLGGFADATAAGIASDIMILKCRGNGKKFDPVCHVQSKAPLNWQRVDVAPHLHQNSF